MRILMCHNYYRERGGTERVVEEEKNELERHGHIVILYVKDSRDIQNMPFYKKLLIPLRCVFSIETWREVGQLVKEHRPDVAHVHNIFPLLSPSIFYVLKRMKVPVVYSVHDYRLLCPNGLFFVNGRICEKCRNGNTVHAIINRCLHKNVFQSVVYAASIGIHRLLGSFRRNVDNIVTVSGFVRSKLVEGGFPEEKVVVNYNFQKLEKISDVARVRKYFAYVGRLSEEKGVMLLIDAFSHLRDIRLKIVGSGPLEKLAASRIRELGVGNIELLGRMEGTRLRDIVSGAIGIIVPSVWYEPMPLVILESWAVETPVIVAHIGGLKEIVTDKTTGLLFNPVDGEDLAERVRFLIKNRELAAELGRNGRREVDKRFSVSTHVRRLEEIYSSVMLPKT